MEHYYSLNQYLRETFGEKVYKLALRGGETCPNRDGAVGTGGCIFCGEGSGAFAAETVDDALKLLQPGGKQIGRTYIAYFQSFTCTYKMTDSLKRRILDAAADPRIVVVDLATRPDCLGPEILDFLRQVQQIKPVWVELGLQSIHPVSSKRMNRRYELPCFERAVQILREAGIDVIVHLILGLPWETSADMMESVQYLNQWDIQGVKLSLLHILRGTELGNRYLEQESRKQTIPGGGIRTGGVTWAEPRAEYPFSPEEYADLLCDCIEHLRPEIVIHRITGDAPKKDLLIPAWSGDKKRVLNTIRKRMEERSVHQGAQLV